jgi:predicted AAA+ superfamily ATPase
MNYQRLDVARISERLAKRLPVFQVMVGPRQVGKTTIARQIMAQIALPSIYATADSPVPLGAEWIETQWQLAVIEAGRNSSPVLLVMDEIQKIRGWSETIKKLWDAGQHAGPDIRLLVLGSSALMLQEGLSESLAGRFFLNRCSHWGYGECRDAFGWDLPHWLFFGGYPGAAAFADNLADWKSYVADSLIETVLARDILQMQRITKPTLLRHLFALAATHPAQILSYNKMLGQLQDAGNTTTLAHYLKLLESAFLISGLEQFSRGTIRQKGSSPKLILWNNALVNALSVRSYEETLLDRPWWGRLVENGVGAHLLATLPESGASLSYWRDGDYEVDFVVTFGEEIRGIEVKSGRSGKLSGLDRFRKKYPQAGTLLIGDSGVPLERFFAEPAKSWFAG